MTRNVTIPRTEHERLLALARPSRHVLVGHDVGMGRPSAVFAGSTIDATKASWVLSNESRYAIVSKGDAHDLAVVGGTFRSTLDHESTTWDTWHRMDSPIIVNTDRFTLVDATILNVGDGVALNGADWALHGVYMNRVHDDAVQNDNMQSGLISDCFFNECYVFYSARAKPGSSKDGGMNTVTIQDSIVNLTPMPHIYNPERYGERSGTGPLFKVSNGNQGVSPRLVIRDTLFVVHDRPAHGSLSFPMHLIDECTGVTMVWLGEGDYPGDLPRGVRLSTNIWDAAVIAADWAQRRRT